MECKIFFQHVACMHSADRLDRSLKSMRDRLIHDDHTHNFTLSLFPLCPPHCQYDTMSGRLFRPRRQSSLLVNEREGRRSTLISGMSTVDDCLRMSFAVSERSVCLLHLIMHGSSFVVPTLKQIRR